MNSQLPTLNSQPSRFEAILKSAESGNADAMNTVAGIYAHGDEGQPVDGVKAILWYERASSAGSGKALGNLAYLYLTGTFLPEDPAKAVELYEKAIEKEPTCDCFFYDLASCYERGVGAPEDKRRAARLYRRAAQLGSGMAVGALRRLGVEGWELGVGSSRKHVDVTLVG